MCSRNTNQLSWAINYTMCTLLGGELLVSVFGNFVQSLIFAHFYEECKKCHTSGSAKSVNICTVITICTLLGEVQKVSDQWECKKVSVFDNFAQCLLFAHCNTFHSAHCSSHSSSLTQYWYFHIRQKLKGWAYSLRGLEQDVKSGRFGNCGFCLSRILLYLHMCVCVCPSVTGVTSHLITFTTCIRPCKPYIF